MSTALKLALEMKSKLIEIGDAMAHYGVAGYRVDMHKVMEHMSELEETAYLIVQELTP